MFRLVLRAMSARRAQGFAVVVLCALAVGSAVAAPWYVLTATHRSTQSEISAATPAERSVMTAMEAQVSGDAKATMDAFYQTVVSKYDVTFGQPIRGVATLLATSSDPGALPLTLAYRDGVCAHVVVVGACPLHLDEVMVTAATAAQLGLKAGDTIATSTAAGKLTLTVTGVYKRTDPNGDYWSSILFSGTGADAGGPNTKYLASTTDGLFTDLDTISQKMITTVSISADLPVPSSLLGTDGLDTRIDAGNYQVRLGAASAYTEVDTLTNAVSADRRSVELGVGSGLLELLAICWFSLFLAARYTARDRRADLGLLKLRGSGRYTLLRLSLGQSLVPMIGGLLVGALAAVAAGYLLPSLADRSAYALELSAIATFIALAGTLCAVAIAEWRTGRADVNDLLRRVPPRRRGVRADIADLVVIMLAAAAAFQGWVDSSPSGLVTVAPGLVVLAIALIAARVLIAVCMSIGAAALRTGRVRTAVGVLQVARRPGIDRVFVLLAVSVALLAIAGTGLQTSNHISDQRAVIDVGAPRVLTVRGTTPLNLMSVVRAADPGGHDAMAAVRYPAADPIVNGNTDASLDQPVVAVDGPRFAAVAAWPDGNSAMTPAHVAALLQPTLPPAAEFTGPSLTVDATATDAGTKAPYLVASIVNEVTGDLFRVGFGPLRGGRQTMTQPVNGCTADLCRVYALEITGPPTPYGAWDWDVPTNEYKYQGITGTGVAVHGLSAASGVVLDGTAFGDVTRWRTQDDVNDMGLAVSYADNMMTMTVTNEEKPNGQGGGGSVYTTDGPIPLPVFTTGGSGDAIGQLEVIGSTALPVSFVGRLPTLPSVGGSGLIVDLTTLQRSTIDLGQNEVFEVWLSAGAPASLISKLQAGGLVIQKDTTIAGYRDHLAEEGPAAALRFQVLAGAVGLLLAAGALVVVAAAERKPRSAELLALRVQGLPRRAASAIGYGGYGILVVLAIATGLLAAILTRLIVANRTQLFIDDWKLIPPGHSLSTLSFLLVAGVALVIYGSTGLVAGRSLSGRSGEKAAS